MIRIIVAEITKNAMIGLATYSIFSLGNKIQNLSRKAQNIGELPSPQQKNKKQ